MIKRFLLLSSLFLTGCISRTLLVCPPIVEYTTEEQTKILEIIERIEEPVLDRFIIDYGNLREKIRQCNK